MALSTVDERPSALDHGKERFVKPRFLCLAGLAAFSTTTPVFADLLTSKIDMNDGPGTGNGGAFQAVVTAGSIPGVGGVGSSALVFCVEINEFMDFSGQFWVDVATSAMFGGAGGPTPDPLDHRTAALYMQWLGLSQTDRTNLAEEYQMAIWALEEEIVHDDGQNRWEINGVNVALHSAYVNMNESTIDNLIASVGNPTSIGNVRILRLWQNQDGTGAKQDQVVLIPAPGAALLAAIGLAGAWFKRRG